MTRSVSLLFAALAVAAAGCGSERFGSCEGVVCPPLQRVAVRAGSYEG